MEAGITKQDAGLTHDKDGTQVNQSRFFPPGTLVSALRPEALHPRYAAYYINWNSANKRRPSKIST
jgi:hypothetical protein